MESYRVSGIPNSGPQRGHAQLNRPSRPHSNGAGSYGLSIRVQGIDGHPYVVLNNQDRGPQPFINPNSNGYMDPEGSFIENYEDYDFRGVKEAGSNSPFVEYRSQKMKHHVGPQNGVTDPQGKKTPGLLNFQKHPEILQPYDPESNSLDGFRSLPSRLPEPVDPQQSSSSKPAPSHAKSSSLDHIKAPVRPPSNPSEKALPQPKSSPPTKVAQPQARMHTQVAQPQSKPRLSGINPLPSKPSVNPQHHPAPPSQPPPQPPTVSSPTSDPNKTSCRSPSSMSSTNSSLERSRHEPDVLPLRRTDSSGPVLQSSSRSRHSSSSSTSKTLDEQMEALYSDSINRHENRRYIPFLAGSGRDIDTGSIPGVDELIEKFDGKDGGQQRRGRAGRRNRINPEDRKRSRSVDSLRDSSSYSNGLTRGTMMEHVLRPSQLRLQKSAGGPDSWLSAVDRGVVSNPSSRTTSAPGSPQNTISKGAGSIQGYKSPQSRSSSLPFNSKESKDGAPSGGKGSSPSLSASLSKPSTSAEKKQNSDADVQVKKTH